MAHLIKNTVARGLKYSSY